MFGVSSREDERIEALMFALARQVTARHDLDDVLTETLRCLRPIVRFGGGSIQLLDDEGWIQMAASDPVAPAHVMSQRVPLGTSIAGRVILTESAIYLPDLNVAQLPGQARRVSNGVRSYFAVPLVVDGRAIGVLQIDAPEPDAWSDRQRSVFSGIAPVVAAAIQNARAHARAKAARSRAAAAESRLTRARELVKTAHEAARSGEHVDVMRHLVALEHLLADVADDEDMPGAVRLPDQRAAAPYG